jgi:hypothetical protein
MVAWRGLEGCYRLFSAETYINKSEVISRDIKGSKAEVVRVVCEVESELAVGIDVEEASGG